MTPVTDRTTEAETVSSTSVPTLMKRLADDVAHLYATEINLAKAEFREAAQSAKQGLFSAAAGGAVTFAGLLVLLASAVYALSRVMEPWLAALIVGGSVTLIGLIMLTAAKKKLEPSALVPERTGEQLQRDKDLAKRKIK